MEPTCTANGKIVYKCSESTCTETKEDTETLKATGHNFENGVCTICNEVDQNYTKEPVEEVKNEIIEN